MDEKAKRRVTMKDIAQETGYTKNTVSRALMGMPDISVATKELIRKKSDEMGYLRNHMASALRSGSTHALALIVGHLTNPYFAAVYNNVAQVAEGLGYTVMLLSSFESAEREMNCIRTALSYHVDGIILFPSQKNKDCLSLLRGSGTPFVIFAREFVNEKTDYVLCEDEKGGYLATKHLIEHGHRKLIYIYDSLLIHSINLRRDGFLRACAELDVPQNDIRVIQNLDAQGQDNVAGTAERIAGLYQLGFTGVVSFCDMIARRLIAQLRLLNLRVPEDVGIVGFDNTDSLVPTSLPLCSIDGHCEEMSEAAVKLIDRRIKGDQAPPQALSFPVRLLCRGSCEDRPASPGGR